MNPLAIDIREEVASDAGAITRVTEAAFRDHPHSQQTEAFIIQGLRNAGALTLSLVADLDRRTVGHIAFSPITISDGSPDWYGLGPVSVWPEHQNRGVGSALIREGLSRLQALGAQGCALLGEPEYYARFGFRNHPTLVLEGVPQTVFLALPFGDRVPNGQVDFHPAFQATA